MTRRISRRLDDLLLLRATQALTDAERTELDGLLQAHEGEASDSYERAAAAVHAGFLRTGAQMPPELRLRIERQALRYLRELETTNSEKSSEP